LLLPEVDQKTWLSDAVNAADRVRGDPLMTIHQQRSMLAQRILSLVLSYEELKDQRNLRANAALQVALGVAPEGISLQPLPFGPYGDLTGQSSSDAIGGGSSFGGLLKVILHHVRVFDGIVVVIAEDRDRLEANVAEEQLGGEIGFANLQ